MSWTSSSNEARDAQRELWRQVVILKHTDITSILSCTHMHARMLLYKQGLGMWRMVPEDFLQGVANLWQLCSAESHTNPTSPTHLWHLCILTSNSIWRCAAECCRPLAGERLSKPKTLAAQGAGGLPAGRGRPVAGVHRGEPQRAAQRGQRAGGTQTPALRAAAGNAAPARVGGAGPTHCCQREFRFMQAAERGSGVSSSSMEQAGRVPEGGAGASNAALQSNLQLGSTPKRATVRSGRGR